MVYDRSWRDGYRADQEFDYGADTGGGRDFSYTSAREYEASGLYGRDGRGGRDRSDQGRGGYDRQAYGARDPGQDRYGRPEQYGRGGRPGPRGGGSVYHGAYAADGRPFEDVGRERHADDDNYRGGDRDRPGYGRQPQGYRYEDRGFFERAGDEVRSWFGDDEAERRRERDGRQDERHAHVRQGHRDEDYHSWRSGQIAALDADYDEYRRENRAKFDSEFSTWRTGRQGQRDLLTKVAEHQEVIGSDGAHVGTVDKVKGDRILLTKNDKDAGGQHHSIPSSWIVSVDERVTLNKSADEAQRRWKDEDREAARSDYGDRTGGGRTDGGRPESERGDARTDLNRSFSGTY